MRSFGATAREFYTHLPRFFRTLRLTGGFGLPTVYLLLTHTIGDSVYMAQFLAVVTGTVPWSSTGPEIPPRFAFPIAIIAAIVSLVWALILAFLAAATYQGMLVLLRGKKHDFQATYRVVAYSHSHGFLVYVIPCCGYFCGLLAAVVFTIVGIALTHGVSGWRAAGAVLFPILACAAAVAGLATAWPQ